MSRNGASTRSWATQRTATTCPPSTVPKHALTTIAPADALGGPPTGAGREPNHLVGPSQPCRNGLGAR